MAVMIGVIAALVAIRKKKEGGRLKKAQEQLKVKQPERCKLYQFPLKMLLLIMLALVFGFFLEWFEGVYQAEIMEQFVGEEVPESFPDGYYSCRNSHPKPLFSTPPQHELNCTRAQQYEVLKEKIKEEMKTLVNLKNYIQAVLIITAAVMILQLDLKIVSASRKTKKLEVLTLNFLGLSVKREVFRMGEGDRLAIREVGEDRFTNSNYCFSVRLVNGKQSVDLMKKACMFDARMAVVQLGYQLDIPYSTRVKKEQLTE